MLNKFLIILPIALGGFCTLFDPGANHFKVHRLEKCDKANTNTNIRYRIFIRLVNFKVTQQDGVETHFQGFIEITQPVQINFRLSIHGLICDGKADRLCKHAFVRKFGYICRKLHELDRPWYEFIKKKFTCPIPAGYYNMGNVTININSLSFLPLTDGYWAIKVYGYSGSDVVMCVYSEMEITELQRSNQTRRSSILGT